MVCLFVTVGAYIFEQGATVFFLFFQEILTSIEARYFDWKFWFIIRLSKSLQGLAYHDRYFFSIGTAIIFFSYLVFPR